MRKALAFLALVLLLVSCATAPKYTSYVSIRGAESPMAQFAAGDIASALDKAGIGISDSDPAWTIRFADINPALGEQAYRVEVLGKIIEITGGDERGLMYGGLEVAEQIELYGFDGIKSTEAEPYVMERGYHFSFPIDMRCPAYATPGTSGQMNIPDMWDMDFWHEFIDEIARNRYNVIALSNTNLYASMVKVPGYEDIALEDVWRTKVPLDNNFAGNLINAVRPEDWENYEVVKKMTIDEKIAFWREVMEYGAQRGVDFYYGLGHIYLFAEHGKHGLTEEMDNPVTVDYYRKSAQALIETYPLLKGLSIGAGENMSWLNEGDVVYEENKWLHDVYEPGINAALEKEPGRKFRLYVSSAVKDLYSDCLAEIAFGASYTGVHMYASAEPHNIDRTMENAVPGYKYRMIFRNEDIFDMRWGDPDFMRSFVKGMPSKDKVYGFITGSDGYCYGVDYSSTDPDLYGKQLYVQKHWYNYMLLGRLAFQPDLSDERLYEIFDNYYEHRKGTDILFEATSEAGKIVPQVNQIYYQDNSDYTWFVSGCWSHPNTNGFLDIQRWMKSSNTFPHGNCISIEDYALNIVEGVENDPSKDNPYTVSEKLKAMAASVLDLTAKFRSEVQQSKKMDVNEKDYWLQMSDDEAMAYLGLYYSEKMVAAVDLRLYNELKDTSYQDSSVKHLEKAAEYFGKYADIISTNYHPQQMARPGWFDVKAIYQETLKDIEIAQKWKPRKMGRSFNAPSKSDYYSHSRDNSAGGNQ